MLNWFRKKSQHLEKIDQRKYKDEGAKENIVTNPKPGMFDVPPKVQQPDAKIDANSPKYKEPGTYEKLDYPTKKAMHQSAADKKVDPNSAEYKDPGTYEKLEHPTKTWPFPAVKQPGTTGGEDANSKKYKDIGTREKLETPTGETKLPQVPINVVTDEKSGKEFLPQGDKEKLITKPKPYKFEGEQQKSNVPGDKYFHKWDVAKPIQKQFNQIEWFKRRAEEVVTVDAPTATEKFDSLMSQVLQAHPDMSVEQAQEVVQQEIAATAKRTVAALDTLLSFADDCPDCFNKLVAHAAKLQKKAATVKYKQTDKPDYVIEKTYDDPTMAPSAFEEGGVRFEKIAADIMAPVPPQVAEVELSDADFNELATLINIDNFNEMYAPVEDLSVTAAKKPPMKALKGLWEASGGDRGKCIGKVKGEHFLDVKEGEDKEQAAGRFCNWLESKMTKKAHMSEEEKHEAVEENLLKQWTELEAEEKALKEKKSALAQELKKKGWYDDPRNMTEEEKKHKAAEEIEEKKKEPKEEKKENPGNPY